MEPYPSSTANFSVPKDLHYRFGEKMQNYIITYFNGMIGRDKMGSKLVVALEPYMAQIMQLMKNLKGIRFGTMGQDLDTIQETNQQPFII